MNILPFDMANVTPPAPVEIAGVDNPFIAWRLVSDLAHSLSPFDNESQSVRNDKIVAAIEMAKNLKPQDTLEAQMIAQLVAAHNVVSEALHRANRTGASEESQLTWLRQATRFMTQFRQHSQALAKYRGTPKEMKQDAEDEAWKVQKKIKHAEMVARFPEMYSTADSAPTAAPPHAG